MSDKLEVIADRHLFLTREDVFDGLREAYNAGLDAAAQECYFTDHIKTVELVAQTIQERIVALKGNQ